ncbi:midasin-like [Colias croceus]|uniref:midasin-like n=1 Tax=Colias crocea TaxID=72248 RepID=UPI001E2804F3|nr:midasin-like [Colias croceus]
MLDLCLYVIVLYRIYTCSDKMYYFKFVFVLLLFEPHSIFTHTIPKPEASNDTDVFEVKPLPDNGLQIIDNNAKKPSLFEIIYYHIIRKPFEQEVHPIEPVEDKKDENKKSVENDSEEKPASAEDAKKTDKDGEDKKNDKSDYDDEDQSAHDRRKREINDENIPAAPTLPDLNLNELPSDVRKIYENSPDFAKFFGGSDENNDSAPKENENEISAKKSNHLPQNQIYTNNPEKELIPEKETVYENKPKEGFKDRAMDMFDEIPSVNRHKGKTYGMDLTGNHGTVWNDLSETPVGIDSNQGPNSVSIDSNENKLNKDNQGNIWSGSNEVQPVSNEKIILTPVTDDGVEIPPAPKIVEQRPDEEEPADSAITSVIVAKPAVKSTEEENVPIHHTNVIVQQPVIIVPSNLDNVIKNSNEDDNTKPLVNNANSEEPLDDFKDKAIAMFNKMPNDFANKEEKPKTYGMDLKGNKGVVWNDLDETPVGSDDVGVPSVNTYKPQETEENNKPSKNIIYEYPKESDSAIPVVTKEVTQRPVVVYVDKVPESKKPVEIDSVEEPSQPVIIAPKPEPINYVVEKPEPDYNSYENTIDEPKNNEPDSNVLKQSFDNLLKQIPPFKPLRPQAVYKPKVENRPSFVKPAPNNNGY